MSSDSSPSGSASTDWSALQARFHEDLVASGQPTFETVRRACVWNARIPDRYPEAIIHVHTEKDVGEAVRFARRHEMRVNVRCGGHHFNAPSLRQGGLLLDLGGLKEISVNSNAGTAVVQPGVTAEELMDALIPHDLAFPVGHCRSVPLGGFLLAGGFGWNGGVWGPSCVSITGVDIVNADGETIHADAGHNTDLYWAVRGGAMGVPGVVTRFHLNLYPLPRTIKTSTLMFDVADMDAAARWLASVQGSLPPSVECIGLVVSPPPEARAQGAPGRVFVVSATAFAESDKDAANWLSPFDNGPETPAPINTMPLVDTPFNALFAGMDPPFPPGHRYAADHVWSNAAAEALLAGVRKPVLAPPSDRDFLLLAFSPKAPNDAPPLPDMALSVTGGIYVGIYAVWEDATRDTDNLAWVRSMAAALDPFREGRYVGEADIDADADRLRQCFSPSAWDRLSRLQRRFDPEARFFSFP